MERNGEQKFQRTVGSDPKSEQGPDPATRSRYFCRINHNSIMLGSWERNLIILLQYVAKKVARDLNINVRVVVGGHTKRLMMNPTVDEVDLLIGSFGAVSKLTTTHVYNMTNVRHVVLEEADTLLDDSFTEKLRHLLKKIRVSVDL